MGKEVLEKYLGVATIMNLTALDDFESNRQKITEICKGIKSLLKTEDITLDDLPIMSQILDLIRRKLNADELPEPIAIKYSEIKALEALDLISIKK